MDITSLSTILEDHFNEDYAVAMRAYMKGKFSFYGIKSPRRRVLTKDFVASVKSYSIEEIIELVDDLWAYDERDYQMIGLDILIAHKRKFKAKHIPNVHHWIVTKSWWDSIDMLVTHVIGQIGKVDIDGLEPHLEQWIQDDNIWLNRTCLIYQLKYKDNMDLHRLFRYIDIVNHKKEFFVQKAIGWSLRQASRYYPSEIAAFIDSRQLSGLAIREGSKYL